jgi:hypothetical protein
MSFTIDEVTGGPYTFEIDAIRDERYRAKVMGEEPNFEAVFAGTAISSGAYEVIRDINKPIVLPVGEFIENVVFNDEETAPKETPAEEAPSGNTPSTESVPQEVSGTESGNATSDTPPVTDTPIFNEVVNNDASA